MADFSLDPKCLSYCRRTGSSRSFKAGLENNVTIRASTGAERANEGCVNSRNIRPAAVLEGDGLRDWRSAIHKTKSERSRTATPHAQIHATHYVAGMCLAIAE